MRTIVPLNFNWRFHRTFNEEYIARDFNDQTFELVNIPHTIHEVSFNNFNVKDYQFVACYRKSVSLEKVIPEHRYILQFDGVGHVATVYMNGVLMTTHYGGYTRFHIDVTDVIQDGENQLVVAVDSRESNNVPPFGGTIDYLTFGGIYREVTLLILNDHHIQDVFIKPIDVLTEPKAEIDVTLSKKHEANLRITINDPKGNCVTTVTESVNDTSFKVTLPFESVELWDLDHPNLYEVTVEILHGDHVIDRKVERTGFRKAEFTPNGFYLNGKKIKICGINRHQMYPYVGYAMPKRVQEKDAEILKHQLGFNLVRTSHYPQSKYFIEACDRLGLLVFEEVPGWQYVGDDEWKEIYIENLHEMILRDRNHPSIILWGVRVNESGDDEAFYRETNRIAKQLDPTRQTGGVRDFKGSQFLEDVYTYNDFSLTTGEVVLQNVEDVTRDSVPYLVTEYLGHTFPTKRYDRENRQLEHALRHAMVVNAYKGDDRISGGIAWCMNDYNTHEDFGSGDLVCYHGILDMYRIPKLAAYTYMAENSKKPFIQVSTNFDIGEYDVGFIDNIYIFTNCDYVEILRNEHSIGFFHPDREMFPHMDHPPIHIPDLYGNILENLEGYDQETVKKIKQFTRRLARIGGLDKITENERKIFNDPKMDEIAWNLYGKYVANWGQKRVSYTIKGYIDDKPVVSSVIGSIDKYSLRVTPDDTVLTIGDTYDATRIVVEEIGDKDNRIQFGFEPIQISVSDQLEIIGPSIISLISGKAAFWIKTKDQVGEGTVTINSPKYGTHTIDIRIEGE